jgi:ParB-like chromosome segregation protein Spo0J
VIKTQAATVPEAPAALTPYEQSLIVPELTRAQKKASTYTIVDGIRRIGACSRRAAVVVPVISIHLLI